MYKAVRAQHKYFGLLYHGLPRHLSPDEKVFYTKALREEVDEYGYAVSLEDEYDALLDVMVFALGALLRHGFEPQGIEEVVNANMQKIVGPLDKRGGFKLDLQKPEGWQPPNLKKYL